MSRYFNLRRSLALCLLVVGTVASGFALFAPARVAAAIEQLVSYACSSNQPCLSVANSSSGKAIVGVAQTNYAIEGRKLVNSNMNPNAPLSTYKGALTGLDQSTNQLDTNAGVVGKSDYGTGVAGVTSFDSSANGFFQQGTLGVDISKTQNGNSGVRGQSRDNVGVYGEAFGRTIPSCPDLFCTKSGAGVFGEADNAVGVMGFGAIAVSAVGAVRRFPALLVARYMSNGPLIDAFGGSDNRTQVLLLDHHGNLTVAGSVTQHGSPMTVRTTSHGDEVGTFAPQQSTPTMEDFGEAQLVEGRAVVRLDPRFASTIDGRFRYLVFLTPQGDCNGLYVAQKTADAFLVREHNTAPAIRERGPSNVAFDYRIVAQPYGPATERLPTFTGTHDEAVTAGVLASVKANLARTALLHRLDP
ncbi:MAG: hypothetical protein WBE79_01945 [Candidatus Cybelea sp.]